MKQFGKKDNLIEKCAKYLNASFGKEKTQKTNKH